MTVRVEYPYLAFGPKPYQKNILIYATDLGSAKQAALLLFGLTSKDRGWYVRRLHDQPPLTYSRM